MANTIKIKRGLSSNLDNLTLQEGELATTTDTRKLYIGNADGTKTELGQQGPQGVRGTKWWVGDFYSQMFDDANNGDLLLNTSEMSPGEVLQFYDGMWDSVANIRGPQGPQGEKGEPGESIPVGSIIPYGSSVVPETYLLCNGQAVSRTDYPELFAIIGTSFGSGDGSTTFNVPDYRDKFVLGAGGDVDLAETGGEKTHTLTVDELAAHEHQLIDTINNRPQVGWNPASPNTNMIAYTAQNGMGRYLNAAKTGGGKPHNNMPPYVGTYYIIKAKQSAGVVATVVDNLKSTSATDALSANQGKILNEAVTTIKGNFAYLSTDITADENQNKQGFTYIKLPEGFTLDNTIVIGAMWADNEMFIGGHLASDMVSNLAYGGNYLGTLTVNLGDVTYMVGEEWYEKCLALYYYPTSASTPPSKIYVRIVLMKTDGFTPGEKISV